MKLAAYHPDIPEMRMDYARYTAGVMDADRALGRILDKLGKDGLADNTIIIYSSLIRNPELYDQQGYMKAADVANFAKTPDLAKLIEFLKADDEGYRYWGVTGCIQLGASAATPETLANLRLISNPHQHEPRHH